MSQRRYITAAGILSFAVNLNTLALPDSYLSVNGTWAMGLLFLIPFGLLIYGLYDLYTQNSELLLHISVIASFLINLCIILTWSLQKNTNFYITPGNCCCAFSVYSLYFIDQFLTDDKVPRRPFHLLSMLTMCALIYMGFVINDSQDDFFPLIILLIQLAFLFDSLRFRSRIPFWALAAAIMFIALFSGIQFGGFLLICNILCLLYGALYFLAVLTPIGRKLIQKLDSASKEPTAPPQSALEKNSAAELHRRLQQLEQLQQLVEAGILNEEEFQAQKDKLLKGE